MGQSLSHLASLNDDVLEHIMDFLHFASVTNLIATHPEFTRWINDRYIMSLTLPMSKNDAENDNFFKKSILKITIEGKEKADNNAGPINNNFIKKLMTNKLKELDLESQHETSRKLFCNLSRKHRDKPLTHLTKMMISIVSVSFRQIASFRSINKIMPNLVDLKISGILPDDCPLGTTRCKMQDYQPDFQMQKIEVFTFHFEMDQQIQGLGSYHRVMLDESINPFELELASNLLGFILLCPKLKQINQLSKSPAQILQINLTDITKEHELILDYMKVLTKWNGMSKQNAFTSFTQYWNKQVSVSELCKKQLHSENKLKRKHEGE